MDKSLKKYIPVINRARGHRLYTAEGKKILDFYQDGGRSVLGYSPKGFSLSLKKEISRGNYSSLPSRYTVRTLKTVNYLSEGKEISWAGVFNPADAAVNYLSAVYAEKYAVWNMLSENNALEQENIIPLWFPFCGIPLDNYLEKYRFVIPVIPFPGNFSPVTVISSDLLISRTADDFQVSPVQLSGNITCISLLTDFIKQQPYKTWDESWNKHAENLDKIWQRTGPYLIPVYKKESHENIFKSFLKKGILVSLHYNLPGALPADLSDGEKKAFFKAAEEIAEEYC